MDRITEITEPIFNALLQLERRGGLDVSTAEMVHQQMCTYLDQSARLGTKLGVSQTDMDDIRYALAGLVDELVLSKGGPLREFWLTRLLQFRYFGENIAGDAFFERLTTLRRDPTRTDVLRVYYLCLMFGFRGKFRVRGGELELLDIIDGVRNELVRARVIPTDGTLSPNGLRPYEPVADHKRNQLVTYIALGAAASSGLIYLVLRLSLVDRATQLVEHLTLLIGS